MQSFKKRKSEAAGDGMIWRQRLKEKATGSEMKTVDHLITNLTAKGKNGKQQNMRGVKPLVQLRAVLLFSKLKKKLGYFYPENIYFR